MHNWFSCKVSYDKTLDSGLVKKTTEEYLIDALSYAEAEVSFIEKIKPFVPKEYTISDIRRARYAEVFNNDAGDRWYKCKVSFIVYDETNNNEKRSNVLMLAQASSVKGAISVFEDGMKGTQSDYELLSVTETKIWDIYPIEVESEKTESHE